jgi:hypothetical protein
LAQLFEDETKYPDNAQRQNFVFLGYPFNPPLPQDDYRAVTTELQQELPVRLWYFLDEVTTQELMRKIWRAILRSDLCVFDISGGNPNVAFELGLAVAVNRPCITLLKTGEANPLGGADLSYSERAEYTSRETLKNRLRDLVVAKSSALRALNKVSYSIQSDAFPYGRVDIENRLRTLLNHLFQNKRATKAVASKIFENEAAGSRALSGLREAGILRLEGQRRAAKWLLSESWVHHDHEVVGE